MTHEVLHLLFGVDWAIAHSDSARLAEITKELAARVDDPLRIELQELSVVGPRDFALAARRWPLLREQLAIDG